MSKSKGKKITIKFTEELTSVIGTAVQVKKETQNINYTANGTYSSDAIERAFDGNLSSYWQSRSISNYIQIDLAQTAKFVYGFKVYSGSSYRPTTYTLSASSDGSSYTTIKTASIPQATGWHELLLDAPIKTRFLRINFGYSSRLYLYEFSLLVGSKISGFTIKGNQYKYVGGPLEEKEYVIDNIEPHPTIEDAILITFDDYARFPTVHGDITVEYDASIGTLAGRGGNVVTFTRTFTPEDLVPEPNPHEEEYITVAPIDIDLNLLDIEYHSGYTTETLSAAPVDLFITLIDVTVVNP